VEAGLLLPPGTSGLVTLTYQPDRLYLAAVIGGLALLALIMLIALWPRSWQLRRRRSPARGSRFSSGLRHPWFRIARPPSTFAAALLLPAAGFWLGGYRAW